MTIMKKIVKREKKNKTQNTINKKNKIEKKNKIKTQTENKTRLIKSSKPGQPKRQSQYLLKNFQDTLLNVVH